MARSIQNFPLKTPTSPTARSSRCLLIYGERSYIPPWRLQRVADIFERREVGIRRRRMCWRCPSLFLCHGKDRWCGVSGAVPAAGCGCGDGVFAPADFVVCLNPSGADSGGPRMHDYAIRAGGGWVGCIGCWVCGLLWWRTQRRWVVRDMRLLCRCQCRARCRARCLERRRPAARIARVRRAKWGCWYWHRWGFSTTDALDGRSFLSFEELNTTYTTCHTPHTCTTQAAEALDVERLNTLSWRLPVPGDDDERTVFAVHTSIIRDSSLLFLSIPKHFRDSLVHFSTLFLVHLLSFTRICV